MLDWKKSLFALSLASLIAVPVGGAAEPVAKTQAEAQAEAAAEAASGAEKRALAAQDPVIAEAAEALQETGKAVKALAEGDDEAATEALERAIGKLEVVLTQHPDLALAPVGVSSEVIDILASPEDIEAAKKRALRLMKDHQLQLARPIVTALASEVRIETTHVPLGSYPLALKSAAALIQTDQTEAAGEVLAQALGTLVVKETIIPLPFINSVYLIDQARALSEKKDRTEEENTLLAALLDAIDLEIARGEALEYGGENAFTPLKAEMNAIREKLKDGGSGKGVFDKLRGMFDILGREHEAATRKNAAQ